MNKDWSFVENKGQLADQYGKTLTKIRYYGHQNGLNLFCSVGKISFVFSRIKKANPSISEATGESTLSNQTNRDVGRCWQRNIERVGKININRVDLVLIGSNPYCIILASDQQEYYENFYLANSGDQGIIKVHSYKTITYKNIYPFIDLVLHCQEKGIKYEFVIYPGGKVENIKMHWEGLTSINKRVDGGISYMFPFGKMEEHAPKTFEEGGKEIKSKFFVIKNTSGFSIAKYNQSKTLIIDPDLIWSTYFGGLNDEVCTTVAVDKKGNIFVSGTTNSTSNIATASAYKTILSGLDEAFLLKFKPSGILEWATYYGGDSITHGFSVAIYQENNIYLAGQTSSSWGISSTGSYQYAKGGREDGFLVKFDSSGRRLWGTYFGGQNYDDISQVCTDHSGNIIIGGNTGSIFGIATAYAFCTIPKNSYFAKFNSQGSLLWSTYFGGNSYESLNALTADPNGNIFITGNTSSFLRIATFGAFQTDYLDGPVYHTDAFLAKFDSGGARIWATYFGGTGDDFGQGVAADSQGNVYMTGESSSSSGIATSGAYKTSISGDFDAFVSKFDSSGKILWSTYFGGKGRDVCHGIAKDNSGNIYISGFTNSNLGIATPGAYHEKYGGGKWDQYIVKFSSIGYRQWSTYFGGENSEGAGFVNGLIALDYLGNIYITAYTLSYSDISTQFVYQKAYAGGSFYGDGYLAKFGYKYKDAGIISIKLPSNSSCPGNFSFHVSFKNYGLNNIDSVKIGWSVNDKIQQSISWYGKLSNDSLITINLGPFNFLSGNNIIKVWTFLPNGSLDSFPENDTMINSIQIFNIPSASAGPDTLLCFNQTYTMQGAGGITYKWTPAKYLSNDTIPNPKAVLPNTQMYNLKVSNQQGCSDSAQVLIKVRPKLKVSVAANRNSICLGEPVILTAAPQGGDSQNYIFTWPSDSFSGNPLIINPKISGWHKVVLSDNCTPLSAEDSIYITVTPKPKASFTWQPNQYVIQKRPVYFNNQSQNASSYLWSFGTKNDSSKGESPTYIYNDTGNYKVTLIAFGNNGCGNDTAIGYIKVIDGTVTIYIPNIFTPNGDCNNDYFGMSGMGIKTCSLTIYNRWGELVYDQSGTAVRSPAPVPVLPGADLGVWDGTFKGAQAPEGVYIYMITATDIFDEKHYLKGNVTLNR